jgi:hypothetical protein
MITFKSLIIRESVGLKLYRGVNPKFGDVDHGRQSIGIKHKLVGALGANYTDNKDIAFRYGKKVVDKTISPTRILELPNYDDVIRLYQKYEKELPAGLAKNIKNSSGEDQFQYIKQSATQLRSILSKRYDAIKVPLGKGDAEYLSTKGLTGNLYIVLI